MIEKYPTTLTISLVLFVLVAPVLFTRESFLTNFDFTQTGQIGDTIGGITAPIIGILNAVLLYITLRRQDNEALKQQYYRHEDQILALVDRKSDMINNIKSSLRLTVKYSENHLEFPFAPTEDVTGEHKGELAVDFVKSYLFNDSQPMLAHYDLSLREWRTFISQIGFAVIEASIALEAIFHSRLPLNIKKRYYEYVSALVFDITLLYDQVAAYNKRFPEDKAQIRYAVEIILDFQKRVDYIRELDPAPEMKET